MRGRNADEKERTEPGKRRKRGKGGFFGRRKRRMVVSGIFLLMALLVGTHLLRPPHVHRRPAPAPLPVAAPGPLYPDPPGIVLHSSDSPAVVHGVPINAARLEHIHRRDHPSWATTFEGKTYYIAYHYVILPDGTIEKGRPDHCPGTHARTHNDWLGICVVGAFSTKDNPHWWPSTPTEAQIRSVVSLCERLMSEYHIPPERVKRHRDLNLTWCPGSRFPYFQILDELKTYAAAHPETHPLTNRVVSLARPGPLIARRKHRSLGSKG